MRPRGRLEIGGVKLLLALALVVVSLGLAACGGDDDDDGGTTTGAEEAGTQSEASAPTRQEFVAQADAICRPADQEISSASEQAGHYAPDGLTRKEAEFIEEEVIPNFQGQIDEIRELTPPPGDEEKIEAALSAAERDLDDLLEDPNRVPEGWQELHGLLGRWGSRACAT